MKFRIFSQKSPLTIELAHHILKSHLFRGKSKSTGFSSSMQNSIWLMLSSGDISSVVITPRNLFYPNFRVTKLLLAAGAEVNGITTALNGATPFSVAASNGSAQLVRLFIESGANVNSVNENGKSALMLAAQSGHCPVLEILYQSGSNISQIDSYGYSATVYAAKYGHS